MERLADLTAAILAGGMGTRLRSVVADRPKVLAEIHGRPFLAYLLDQLASASVRDVVLCTGYLGEKVEAEFGDSYHGLHLTYSLESSPRGTAGALQSALPLVRSDTVLVMNGDSFYDADLKSFWSWHTERVRRASILVTEGRDAARYGRVRMESDGRVLSFEEKGGESGAGWINAGIYLLQRGALQTIPANGAVSMECEVFPGWIGQGLYGCRTAGRFLDIGTPSDYAEAERFFGQLTHSQR